MIVYEEEEDKSHRPPKNLLAQQRLPAWQPVMEPTVTMFFFFMSSVLVLILGGFIIKVSNDMQVVDVCYNRATQCLYCWRVDERERKVRGCSKLTDCGDPSIPVQYRNKRVFEFDVPVEMRGPIYMYYRLPGFHQNYRQYAKSVSYKQLAAGPDPDISTCGDLHGVPPWVPNGNTSTITLANGLEISLSDFYYNPCGLTAWSMFNDSFVIRRMEADLSPEDLHKLPILCDTANFDPLSSMPIYPDGGRCAKKDISWADDGNRYRWPRWVNRSSSLEMTYRGLLVKNPDASAYARNIARGEYVGEDGHKIPQTVDEDFTVWMNIASTTSVHKLFRYFPGGIPKGSYVVEVNDNYPVDSFKGKKCLLLTPLSWVGGQNFFLGAFFIMMGSLSFTIFLGFLLRHCKTIRRQLSNM